MSTTTQTSLVEASASAASSAYPMTELRRAGPSAKDAEASTPVTAEEGDSPAEDTDVVRSEPETPFVKLLVAGYSFFCAGVNDGTLGPLIPYIISSFRVGTGEIAIIYGTTFAGWLLAAVTNPIMTAHMTLGQLLAVGAVLQLLAHCLRPWSPLPLFCIAFFLQALGMAYQDSHSNTFVSGLKNVPHRWLSFIHACYALGCFIGPLIATAIATGPNSMAVDGWKRVYLILIGICAANVAGVAVAFRGSLRSRPNSKAGATSTNTGGNAGKRRNRAAMLDTARVLRSRALWLLSLFYFFSLGANFTASGWVVEFLATVRGGDLGAIGYVPTGFYGGMLAGRLLLAEPTFRYGEQRMLLVYSALCAALQLVFWLQPNIVGSAVALSFMGFFTGPFFATGMSVASKLFPRESQTAALGFIFVLAQAGGALFPSITGLIAANAGVAVLQPIVLALFVAGGISWWLVPKVPQRSE
ncbi:MFS general substrate transporter [Daldinia bambusicola]|nr:MFS general substrate transporter [Daldinia bambusicola]